MGILDLQVADSEDDVNHRSDHIFQTTSIALVGGHVVLPWGSAMRFSSVAIPKGSLIDVAHLIFTPRLSLSNIIVKTRIYCHASDNSNQILDDAAWHTIVDGGAELTSDFAQWNNILPWTSDVEFQGPSIIAPIQEVINRDGWAEGNALTIFWLDDGSSISATRQAHSADEGVGDKAVKIHLEFTLSSQITDSEIMNFNLKMSQNPVFNQAMNHRPDFTKRIEQNPSFTRGIGRNPAFDLEA